MQDSGEVALGLIGGNYKTGFFARTTILYIGLSR